MQTEVLIVGAGLAGLSLGAALQDQGIDFRLVEARDRSGGRILSHPVEDNANPLFRADLGPSWIWPGQALVAAMLHDFGIAVFEQFSDGFLVYQDELGQVRRDLDYSSMAGSLRIEGGIAKLTERLTESLAGDTLLLSHRVDVIRRLEQGYRVDFAGPGGQTQLTATRVVLAIPPRLIASHIEFEPALARAVIDEMSSIPTWMAGHAKLFAIYDTAFWREQGLSGDGISRIGPLMEIHDASPAVPGAGALFGFVGVAAGSPQREPERLKADAIRQLGEMYGPAAAKPTRVILKDWSLEEFTATKADQLSAQHSQYGTPPGMAALADSGLLFACSEMAPRFGGFIEGALEASQHCLGQLVSKRNTT